MTIDDPEKPPLHFARSRTYSTSSSSFERTHIYKHTHTPKQHNRSSRRNHTVWANFFTKPDRERQYEEDVRMNAPNQLRVSGKNAVR